MLYSYLLRPTTAKHSLADAVLRQETSRSPALPANTPIICSASRRTCARKCEAQGLADLYETIDLPLAPVLAAMERHGVRVDRKALGAMSETMEREIRALEKTIWDTGRIGIQRQFAAAARRNSVRQDES